MQVSWMAVRRSYTEARWLKPLAPENIPKDIRKSIPAPFMSISPIFIGVP
jgi:hypothetical protein